MDTSMIYTWAVLCEQSLDFTRSRETINQI